MSLNKPKIKKNFDLFCINDFLLKIKILGINNNELKYTLFFISSLNTFQLSPMDQLNKE